MTLFSKSSRISNIEGDIEELKRTLPHADLETGLRNRDFNKTLLCWDADSAEPITVDRCEKKSPKRIARNPIALTGDLGDEVDSLRCTPRPRTATPREPQRDPIAGQGNFGHREWDPIWKYNGKARRARSSTGDRCNPLTGKNVKTFTISMEEKNRGCMTPTTIRSDRNILTGEHCQDFEVSADFKSSGPKRRQDRDKNAITGENCNTYDVNVENAKTARARVRTESKKTNPVNGENVDAFTIMKEERPRNAKSYVYSNALTGENCPSYKINPIERNVSARPNATPANPVLGVNTQHYTYRMGEKEKQIKSRDISSPLTGPGSRGNTYSVSVEERRRQSNTSKTKSSDSIVPRNVLTGENCSTYMVCQEMRSERKTSNNPNVLLSGNADGYNIITGTAG